jgi:plasmid stabilization system protein ParE
LIIIWSPLAVKRLEEIFDFICEDNPVAARKLIESIFNKIEHLSKYPERGRKVPEVNRAEIREVFEGAYRIVYRIDKKRISILTIRNFKQVLPESDFK